MTAERVPSPGTAPDVIEAMLARRSAKAFTDVGPTPAELELVMRAASTVPDHGTLRPWRFVVVEGDARHRFGDALAAAASEAVADLPSELVDKARRKAFVAPCLVVLIATPVLPSKIPTWEQISAASCTGYAMVLAADALDLGAVWKSAGAMDGVALRDLLGMSPQDRLLGWVNLGRSQDIAPRGRDADLSRVAVLGGVGLEPWPVAGGSGS